MFRLASAVGAIALAAAIALPAQAQKPRIEKAADLPRFTYPVSGKVEAIVTDPAKFADFAKAVRRDTESILDKYDIADREMLRSLEGLLARLDYLDGNYDAAAKRVAHIRELEEKPSSKLMSGVSMDAMIAAHKGNLQGDAYAKAVGGDIRAKLDKMPYNVVANDVREAKASAEIRSEALVLGYVREVIQPTVDKAGSISSDLAPAIVNARYSLTSVLPLKGTLVDAYGGYLAANKVDKPDIWADRDVALAPGKGYAPVNVAVWDSGVDLAQYKGRTVNNAKGVPEVLAFDRFSKPAKGELMPIPDDLKSKVPQMKAMLKGFSDLQSNIDSAEATQVKTYLSGLKPDEYKSTIEQIGLVSNWMHGTHVAGITMKGNPYARLVVGRIEFDWHLLPDPCPTMRLARLDAKNAQSTVDFFKRNHVRVVNMSWGGNVKAVEEQLELCQIGKTPDERAAKAREMFEVQHKALTKAFASAPGILFIAAAGNSNQDASFIEDVPAGIKLPNLIAVAAVDKAGDEASFTSYGPTVVVAANGYQVDSTIPGGDPLAESGTSMASPQVANLAAKILAVNPKLKPIEVIEIIRSTADTTADGRRHLINPKKALAKVGYKAAP